MIFLHSDLSYTDSRYIKYANKFLSEDARLKELWEGFLNSSTILFGVGWGGGGEPRKFGFWCTPPFQNSYPIMTKICGFSYPIYDLTKNLAPYL